MTEILEIFKTISSVSHCSHETKALKDFLVKRCQKIGAKVQTDSVGNILVTKGSPTICLQSHYDMVCVGKAPDIEFVYHDNILKAKDSSLGADNGIGVAMMLYLLEKKENLQALFTNDEEVGLIGANGLELPITAKYLLNLDSEDEGNICLGCAGGVDIQVSKEFELEKVENYYKSYLVETTDFLGGHSGVDIDKDIKNAIKELSFYLKNNSCLIHSIDGGEAGNAIPKKVVAKVLTKNSLKPTKHIMIKEIEPLQNCLNISESLLNFLVSFPTGVRSYDKELNLVQTSINLATIKTLNDKISIEISPRAMSEENMQNLLLETTTFLKGYGFDYVLENPYPSWKPFIGEFAKKVQKISKKYFDKTDFYAIHAGLECGVILSKNPHLEAISIGPTIRYPHSTREEVEVESIKKVFSVLDELI